MKKVLSVFLIYDSEYFRHPDLFFLLVSLMEINMCFSTKYGLLLWSFVSPSEGFYLKVIYHENKLEVNIVSLLSEKNVWEHLCK